MGFSDFSVLAFLQSCVEMSLALVPSKGRISALDVLFQRPILSHSLVKNFVQNITWIVLPVRPPLSSLNFNLVSCVLQTFLLSLSQRLSCSCLSARFSFWLPLLQISRYWSWLPFPIRSLFWFFVMIRWYGGLSLFFFSCFVFCFNIRSLFCSGTLCCHPLVLILSILRKRRFTLWILF